MLINIWLRRGNCWGIPIELGIISASMPWRSSILSQKRVRGRSKRRTITSSGEICSCLARQRTVYISGRHEKMNWNICIMQTLDKLASFSECSWSFAFISDCSSIRSKSKKKEIDHVIAIWHVHDKRDHVPVICNNFLTPVTWACKRLPTIPQNLHVFRENWSWSLERTGNNHQQNWNYSRSSGGIISLRHNLFVMTKGR
jgi:hypothetical protein